MEKDTNKELDIAFDAYLEGDQYDEAEGYLMAIASEAFTAGWLAAVEHAKKHPDDKKLIVW